MRKLTKKKYMAIALGLALVAVILWTLWGNTALTVNTYTVSGDTIPDFGSPRSPICITRSLEKTMKSF